MLRPSGCHRGSGEVGAMAKLPQTGCQHCVSRCTAQEMLLKH